MRILCLMSMLGLLSLGACQTATKVGEAAAKISEKIDQIQAGVEAGNKKTDEIRAALVDRVKADPDLSPAEKDDLLKEIGGAPGGIMGLGALASLAYAYLKRKVAAKAAKALGTVMAAESKLPEGSREILRSAMKDLGGDHPDIKTTIAQAKQA